MGRERREFGSIRKLASGRHQAVYTGPDLLRHVASTTASMKSQFRRRVEHRTADSM